MFLAEAAQVEIRNYVNTNQGESYSVTTTTVNGVTTTQTQTYAPGEPVIVAATASATGQKIQTGQLLPKDLTPTFTITPFLSPSPAPQTLTPPSQPPFIYSIFRNLYLIFSKLFGS